MQTVTFDGRFVGWRAAARSMLHANVPPHEILWMPEEECQPMLFEPLSEPGDAPLTPLREPLGTPLRIPREYVQIAESAACYRDAERWSLLYRLAWRITHGEWQLLALVTDRDVARLLKMEHAVRRDMHKMKAFVRFRRVQDSPDGLGTDRFVAWFNPAHDIVERIAPFFAHRFTSMDWTILTPHRSLHWDRSTLTISGGLPRSAAPSGDELETLWRTYYASIFNPARIKLKAMRAEMPKKYWNNLPETSLIPELIHAAPRRVGAMLGPR